jgi:hypothetical protein|tara:strand:- start:774 stop:989 length:216 start_codon:yes stop_codon:yes gene_type:complete
MSNLNVLKFSDEVVAQVAKSLQVALLTGTDVVDNFRQLELEVRDDKVYLTENYKKNFANNIDNLIKEASEK